MRDFRKLKVWHQLALTIYRVTASFPRSEQFGLTSQLRRAATSIPINIAEGSKRLTGREFERFLNIAEASAAEVQYLLILCRDPGCLDNATATRLLKDAARLAAMLNMLRKTVGHSARH